MPQTIRLILNQDGSWEKETTNLARINVSDAVYAAIAGTAPKKLANVLSLDSQPASLVIADNLNYWTIPLGKLTLVAPFRMAGEHLVPNFSSGSDPVLTIEWWPPVEMNIRLRLLCALANNASCPTIWLLAFDKDGQVWRLPLANVYDDCKLCSGQAYPLRDTQETTIRKILEDFRKSPWNQDLWDTQTETQSLFRFKLRDKDFEFVAPTRDWTAYCRKVSLSVSQYCVL